MTLAYTNYDYGTITVTSLASGTITYTAGQPILVMTGAGTAGWNPTIADTASLTWALIADYQNAYAQVRVWSAVPVAGGSTVITISNFATASFGFRVRTYTGAGTPLVLANGTTVYGTLGTTISYTATPTSSGSDIFLWLAGYGYNTVNNPPSTPGTGCTLESVHFVAGQDVEWMVRPTTSPLTSSAAFTLSTTADGSYQVHEWVAIEVPAAGGGGGSPTPAHYNALMLSM